MTVRPCLGEAVLLRYLDPNQPEVLRSARERPLSPVSAEADESTGGMGGPEEEAPSTSDHNKSLVDAAQNALLIAGDGSSVRDATTVAVDPSLLSGSAERPSRPAKADGIACSTDFKDLDARAEAGSPSSFDRGSSSAHGVVAVDGSSLAPLDSAASVVGVLVSLKDGSSKALQDRAHFRNGDAHDHDHDHDHDQNHDHERARDAGRDGPVEMSPRSGRDVVTGSGPQEPGSQQRLPLMNPGQAGQCHGNGLNLPSIREINAFAPVADTVHPLAGDPPRSSAPPGSGPSPLGPRLSISHPSAQQQQHHCRPPSSVASQTSGSPNMAGQTSPPTSFTDTSPQDAYARAQGHSMSPPPAPSSQANGHPYYHASENGTRYGPAPVAEMGNVNGNVNGNGIVEPFGPNRERGPTEPRRTDHERGRQVSGQASPNGQAPTGVYRCDHEGCTAPPFNTQYLLTSHKNVHSEERPHFCPIKNCPRAKGGLGFKRKNEMNRHRLVHSSPGYICPFCADREHRYPRPDNLQRHVRGHHSEEDVNDDRLRQVLAQRPEGPGRRRRRVTGQ
ncbi:MAG: hypothetical protein M1815_002078 [Lichina confinis]|nr:MAG: hypothetical protein M1815_002078 [Lichina confinis]